MAIFMSGGLRKMPSWYASLKNSAIHLSSASMGYFTEIFLIKPPTHYASSSRRYLRALINKDSQRAKGNLKLCKSNQPSRR